MDRMSTRVQQPPGGASSWSPYETSQPMKQAVVNPIETKDLPEDLPSAFRRNPILAKRAHKNQLTGKIGEANYTKPERVQVGAIPGALSSRERDRNSERDRLREERTSDMKAQMGKHRGSGRNRFPEDEYPPKESDYGRERNRDRRDWDLRERRRDDAEYDDSRRKRYYDDDYYQPRPPKDDWESRDRRYQVLDPYMPDENPERGGRVKSAPGSRETQEYMSPDQLKKEQYRRELDEQMRAKQLHKQREKIETRTQDSQFMNSSGDFMRSRGGGGAPMKDAYGNVVTARVAGIGEQVQLPPAVPSQVPPQPELQMSGSYPGMVPQPAYQVPPQITPTAQPFPQLQPQPVVQSTPTQYSNQGYGGTYTGPPGSALSANRNMALSSAITFGDPPPQPVFPPHPSNPLAQTALGNSAPAPGLTPEQQAKDLYRRELEAQVREKELAKQKQKQQEFEMDIKEERRAAATQPWENSGKKSPPLGVGAKTGGDVMVAAPPVAHGAGLKSVMGEQPVNSGARDQYKEELRIQMEQKKRQKELEEEKEREADRKLDEKLERERREMQERYEQEKVEAGENPTMQPTAQSAGGSGIEIAVPKGKPPPNPEPTEKEPEPQNPPPTEKHRDDRSDEERDRDRRHHRDWDRDRDRDRRHHEDSGRRRHHHRRFSPRDWETETMDSTIDSYVSERPRHHSRSHKKNDDPGVNTIISELKKEMIEQNNMFKEQLQKQDEVSNKLHEESRRAMERTREERLELDEVRKAMREREHYDAQKALEQAQRAAEFDALKYQLPSPAREQVLSRYPDPATSSSNLEVQQRAVLKAQMDRSAFDSPPPPAHIRSPVKKPTPQQYLAGQESSDVMKSLASNSRFVYPDGHTSVMSHRPTGVEQVAPSGPKRTRTPPAFESAVTEQSLQSSLGTPMDSLNLQAINARNERRLGNLEGLGTNQNDEQLEEILKDLLERGPTREQERQ